MLKIYDKNHNAIGYLVKYRDCKIESDVASGDKTLSFTYLAKHHNLTNEMYVRTKEDEFVIKEISTTTDSFPQIVAVLNLEDLQKDMWQTYSVTDTTIDAAARTVLAGTGWTIGECDVTKKRNAGMMQVSTLDVIQKLCTAFMCEPVFDTLNKRVSFYTRRGEDKGVYFISGLNLKKLQKKSTSHDYYTRIIPIGQDNLSIADVNDGKNYLENYQYSNKVLTYIWKDESYTDPQALMEDAELKLEDLSKPAAAYSVDVRDLASQKPEYSVLSYSEGDTVKLIDRETGTMTSQRIKKIVRYPDDPEKNTCEIANTFLTFEELQQKYQDAAAIINYTVTGDGRYTGTINVSEILKFEQGIAGSSTIGTINGTIASMEGDLSGVKLTLGEVETNYLKAEEAELKYATIENLTVVSESVHSLDADYGAFKAATANEFAAHTAILDNLKTAYASVDFANIDTANIDKAKVATLFAEMGLISTAVIEEGHVTGYLDSVSINANSIKAGTLSVDRLVINGSEQSLIYALNNAGELTSTSVDTLDGDILTDRTITADKLVAHSITANEITVSNIVGASGWINLAEGTFNYGNQLIWDGAELTIAASAITMVTDGKYASKSEEERLTDSITRITANESSIELLVSTQESFSGRLTTTESQISVLQENIDLRVKYTDLDAYSTTAQMEAAINLSADSITQTISETYTTKTEFNDLEIGGRNLWLYTKEYDASKYEGWVDNNNGNRALTSAPYTTVNGFGVQRIAYAWTDISQRVSIEPNTDYTLSAWIKWEDEIGIIDCYYGNTVTAQTNVAKDVGNTSFKRISVTFNSGDSTVSNCRFESRTATPYLIYGLKLEKGNKATDWTPAPEDTEDKITSLETWKTEASQKITKDGIIATVGNYYAYQSDMTSAESRITQAESTLTQHADEIALKVAKDGVIGAINLSSEEVKINAAKITLEGATIADNFTATNLTVTGNSTFSGTLNGATGSFSGSVDAIYIKAKESYSIYVPNVSEKIILSAYGWNPAGLNENIYNYGAKFEIPDITGSVNVSSNYSGGTYIKTASLFGDYISINAPKIDIGELGGIISITSDVECTGDILAYGKFQTGSHAGSWYAGFSGNDVALDVSEAGDLSSVNWLARIKSTYGVWAIGAYNYENSSLNFAYVDSANLATGNNTFTLRHIFYTDGRVKLSNFLFANAVIQNATGVVLNNSAVQVGLHGTESMFRPRMDDDGAVTLGSESARWKKVYAVSNTIGTSDERDKDIIGKFGDRHKNLFMSLVPIEFRWKDKNIDDVIHFGLGAQTTEESAIACGFGQDAFGMIEHGYWNEPNKDGRTDRYGISYAEISMLTIPVVQDHERRLINTETQIEILQYRLDQAYDEIAKLKQQLAS